jgi:hypothetical protein
VGRIDDNEGSRDAQFGAATRHMYLRRSIRWLPGENNPVARQILFRPFSQFGVREQRVSVSQGRPTTPRKHNKTQKMQAGNKSGKRLRDEK